MFDPTVPPPAGYVDMIPVEVILPDGTLVRRARVMCSPERTVVWAENPSEPSVVDVVLDVATQAVHEWPSPYAVRREQRLRVLTGVGELTANALGSCATCGSSALRSVAAFETYPEPVST